MRGRNGGVLTRRSISRSQRRLIIIMCRHLGNIQSCSQIRLDCGNSCKTRCKCWMFKKDGDEVRAKTGRPTSIIFSAVNDLRLGMC